MQPSPIPKNESSGKTKKRFLWLTGEKTAHPQPSGSSVTNAAVRDVRIKRYLERPEPVVPASLPRPPRYLLSWMALLLTALAVMGWLIFRPRDLGHHPPLVRPEPRHLTDALGMDRLSEALAMVPAPAIPGLFREANRWLATRGSPPCSVQSPSGQVSIVLGFGTLSDQPLVKALSRCADAVEDLLKVPAP